MTAPSAPSAPAGLLRRTLRRRQARIGAVLTVLVVAVALLGPLIGPLLTGYGVDDFAGRPFRAEGIAGTDDLGRDVFTRFLAGGGPVLLYALAATAIGIVGGTALGMLAGYSGTTGSRLDTLIMRGGDVLLSFPQLVLALLAVAVLGSSGWLLVLVIGITHIPRVARVARQATLSVAGQDYVQAARMYGMPRRRILATEVLPNITGPLMVELGLRLTYSIGYVASLSFLGLGVQPPASDWGLQINENRIALIVTPWGVLLPVLAIAVLTVGTNMITDALAKESADTTGAGHEPDTDDRVHGAAGRDDPRPRGAARRGLGRRTGRDPGPGRRVRVGQDHRGAGRARPLPRRADPHRRDDALRRAHRVPRRPAHAARGDAARDPGSAGLLRAAGPGAVAEPGAAHRTAGRGGPHRTRLGG